MTTIEIRAGCAIPEGTYWLKQYDSRRMSAVSKTLHGLEFKTPRFWYALFRNGDGYAVKYKERHIPEQEQTWTLVAEVTPCREGEVPT